MEPTAAFGLAGNVVQFVFFACTMLESSREIHRSSNGIAQEVFDLEKTYGELQNFAQELREDPLAIDKRFAEKPDVQRSIRTLESIATECSETCNKLMNTLQGLQVRPGSSDSSRRYNCLIAALKTAWSRRDIQSFEEQLDRHQRLIALHSIVLFRQQMSHQMDKIEAMMQTLLKQHECETPKRGRLSRFFRRIFRRDSHEARPSATEEEAGASQIVPATR